MVRRRNEVHCVGRSDALRLDCVGPEQVGAPYGTLGVRG
jgi:hypothetical protein